MMVNMKIDGLKELEGVMKNLGPELAKREAKIAVGAGARVIKRAVEANAPVGEVRSAASLKYGRIKDNIRVTRRKKARFSEEYAIHTGPAFWAVLYELGTSKQQSRPFFTPAFDQSGGAAVKKMADTLARRLPKLATEIAGRFGSISKTVKRRI